MTDTNNHNTNNNHNHNHNNVILRDELYKVGYYIISNVINIKQCHNAMNDIWNFIEDTTYYEMKRCDYSCPSIIMNHNTSNNNNNNKNQHHHDNIDISLSSHNKEEQQQVSQPQPQRQQQEHEIQHGNVNDETATSDSKSSLYLNHNYYYQCNYGAGWLLFNIREILALHIYNKLIYHTQYLYSSKEGFILIDPLSINNNNNNNNNKRKIIIPIPTIDDDNNNTSNINSSSIVAPSSTNTSEMMTTTTCHQAHNNNNSNMNGLSKKNNISFIRSITCFERSVMIQLKRRIQIIQHQHHNNNNVPNHDTMTTAPIKYNNHNENNHSTYSNDKDIIEVTIHRGDVFLWILNQWECFIVLEPVLSNNINETIATTERIIDTNNNNTSIALLLCCMGPCHNSNDTSNNTMTSTLFKKLKMDSYKHRRTCSTYKPYEEKWIDDHNDYDHHHYQQTTTTTTNNNNTIPIGRRRRQYYRTSPPLLTIRQAELAGLIPYETIQHHHDNNHINNKNHDTTTNNNNIIDDRIQYAMIQGVRFVSSNTYHDDKLLMTGTPRYDYSNDIDDCHLEKLHVTDPSDKIIMNGKDKYLGGMSSSCSNYIYGVPGHATRVLRIDIHTGNMDFIGPTYHGKFKWLRGLTISYQKMIQLYCTNTPTTQSSSFDTSIIHDKYPLGCCIALPCNSPCILKINPADDSDEGVTTFGHDILPLCGSTNGWYYHGGIVSSINGWIYMIPANANRILKCHPITQECLYIGPIFDIDHYQTTITGNHDNYNNTIVHGQRWFGGIEGSDQCIYGIPHNEFGVLKIDPRTDQVTVLYLDDGNPLPIGQWKWHGGLRSKHKIYGFPNNADSVLVIDCQKQSVYTISGTNPNINGHHHPDNIIQSGRHRAPNDDRYKYLGGATNDIHVYLFPCDAEQVLRINCITDEMQLIGSLLLDGENKFQNGFYSKRDQCIYGIPQRASGVLRIIPKHIRRKQQYHSKINTTTEQYTVTDTIDDDTTKQDDRFDHDTDDYNNRGTNKDGLKDDDTGDNDDDDDYVDIIDCGSDMIGVKDKFEGGVLGPDGCIYCIPLHSSVCVKIVPATNRE